MTLMRSDLHGQHSQFLRCFIKKYSESLQQIHEISYRNLHLRLSLPFQRLCRQDLCLDIQEKMPAGNTALMGLICGALPCILDKPNNSARVVRSPSSNTTLLTLTISSRTSLSPYPCPKFSCYLLTRFLACSLWCWWPSSTGLMTTPGRSPHPR